MDYLDLLEAVVLLVKVEPLDQMVPLVTVVMMVSPECLVERDLTERTVETVNLAMLVLVLEERMVPLVPEVLLVKPEPLE